jgi:hypothetical protein
MKVSDLFHDGATKAKKGMKLDIRVPAKLVEKIGSAKAKGELVSVVRDGENKKSVKVRVSVAGKVHAFRPQDLSAG